MFGLQQEADRINSRKSLQGAVLAKNRRQIYKLQLLQRQGER